MPPEVVVSSGQRALLAAGWAMLGVAAVLAVGGVLAARVDLLLLAGAGFAVATVAFVVTGLILRETRRDLLRPIKALQALTLQANDALILVDESQRIRLFGGAAPRMFGYEPGEVLGEPLSMLLPLQHRARHESDIEQFRSEGETVRHMDERRQVSGLTKEGTTIPLEVTIANISVDGAYLAGAIIRDVSERALAIERLSVLAESRLRLIASVSHEIRTPLTAVLGYAELLRGETVSEDEVADVVATIASEAQDMADIVEDLLTAARFELGEIEIVPVDLDLLEQAQRVHASLAAAGERLAVTGDSVKAIGDPARVRQVLRNLVSNAIEHGGSWVSVDVERSGAVGRVRVVDDGDGPPPHVVELMFEAFTAGRQAEGYPGSFGLGLTISRRLALAMDGDVTFEREGGNTVFTFALPLAPSG